MPQCLGISIKEMMQLDVMNGSKILAGEKGIKNIVTKVNVMEVPDILDWVTKGELLLTTAYPIRNDINVLENLIPRLKEKGVAGICIKMQRYIKELPKEIILIADEMGFPIIEMPYHISYTDIITPVLTEIINSQASTLIKIKELHNSLVNVMLKGGDFKEIAMAISDTTGNAVAIKENILGTMVICCDMNEKEREIRNILECEESLGENTFSNKEILFQKQVERIVFPIHVENHLHGHLIIWEDHKKLNEAERASIEAAIPIIALNIMKKIAVLEIESRHKVEFFDDLLSNDESRHKKALDKALLFEFDISMGYVVMVISINTLNNTPLMYYFNRNIIQIIENIKQANGINLIYANRSDKIIILYGINPNIDSELRKNEIDKFSNNIVHNINHEYTEKIAITLGIGRYYKNTHQLWKGYQEALKAVERRCGNKNKEIVCFEQLGIHRILGCGDTDEEIQYFYKDILDPLVQYDRNKDSELIKTLNAYFQCDSNLKKTSERLFTHYNTIVYRMQRIVEITGLSLQDADDKLNLQVALKIHEICKQKCII